jgi:superfamily II DNA helicase RecQ
VVDASGESRDVNNRRDSSNGSGSGDVGDTEAAIKAEIKEWIKKEEEEYKVSTVATEIDPWLQYTSWEEVLAGSKHSLVKTAEFTATATADEPELECLLQSWERIVQRSLATLAAVSQYKDILKWWASPKNEAASQKPFELPQNHSKTVPRYSQTFGRLLCYIIRAAPEEPGDESETGVVFSATQWVCIQDLRDILQQPVAVAVAEADEARSVNKDVNTNEGIAVAVADNKLDNAVMALIMSLLAQDTSQLLLYESPVMHYLAVRGVNPQTKRFYPSFQYTTYLAHMIWIIRLLILEMIVPEQGWPELRLPSRKETGAVAGAVAEQIHKARRQYLCEGSFSPASSILSQLAFGQAQNRNQSSEANIYWSDDRQTVFYNGKGVEMAKVRGICQELTVELEGLLHELLFSQSVKPVPLPQLVDSMGTAQRFQQKGYSFLDHPDNARWEVSWEFLWERMLKADQKLVKSSGSGSGSGQDEWTTQAGKAYLAREKQFLLKLIVAMHIQGGQPARSPEMGSIKVRNSAISSRNIFVINGRVAVVTTYDKSRKRRSKTEYVFRCFPDQLSQIIAQYLVYILPFTRVVSKTKGDFLFAVEKEEPWIQDQLSTAVAVATAKHLGVRLTVSSWRHVAIAISDEHLRKASRIWRQRLEDEDEDGEAMAGESDGEVEQSLFEHILVRQSAHGRQTAAGHYAIDGAFLNRLGPDLVSAYSQASRAWHKFLQLESKGAAVAVAVAVKRPGSPIQRVVKREKLEVSRGLQGLQKVLGPDAQPRSQGQAEALELVHSATLQQPQIIVLGTGSGKSLLFFSVAAMASQQTVIVVVPFAALVDDLVRRARACQLTCEEWQWQREWVLLPQLLIVSADRAVEGDFLHYAKGLELSKQLAHVFFDECHVAVTDTSYRAKLRQLWQLRYLRCRFTCLTATLLTTLEPVLRANLLVKQAQIYRQSTMRPTIRYQVIECQRDIWATAEPLIRRLPLPPGSRGVIYVRSYAQGESVAEEMDCPFYKATATGKQELLEQWASGSGGWIVATGALGTGIDIPGVVYIIHLGRPYGLTSFMQQAGRGGRAGEISDSIVILPSSGSGSGEFSAPRQELVNAYSVEAEDEAALTEYIESGSCRRAVLAKHLDGYTDATSCIATDSILCDRCEALLEPGEVKSESEEGSGSGSSLENGAEAIHQALRSEVQQDEQLERFHQMLHGHCIYCRLMLDQKGDSHCHRDCPHVAARSCDVEAYRQWRSRLTLARRDQCFRCGLSQSICTAVEDQRPCTYPHLMLPGIFFLYQVGQLRRICQEVGFRGGEEWQWQWMNEAGEEGFRQWEINWMRVWRRIAEIYLEIEDSEYN